MIFSKLLISFLIFLSLYSCSKRISIIYDRNTKFTDYLINTQKLNFHIDDTIIKTHICVRPDGDFYFNDSIERKPQYLIHHFKIVDDSIENYEEKYISKTSDVFNLYSYFPPFIVHDSSVINHYNSADDWGDGYQFEMYYSSILANLDEPRIKKSVNGTEIRATFPQYDDPGIFPAIRLKMENGKGVIFYSEGQYDSLANFILLKKDSSIIKPKYLLKTNKLIQNIELDKEYYFTEIGLNVGRKFLVEIKLNDEYYVFERGLYNDYNKNKQLQNFYSHLIWLKSKHLTD